MSAPNLIAFYGPLSIDPVLSWRPQAIRGIYEQGQPDANPCDWFDVQAGQSWKAAQAGQSWKAAQAGQSWKAAQAGQSWSNPRSGGWFDDKDCD